MNDNDIIALEQLVEKYPWYSLAHLELYKKFCERGPEARGEYLQRAAAYVHSRELLYEITQIHDAASKEESTDSFEQIDKADAEPFDQPDIAPVAGPDRIPLAKPATNQVEESFEETVSGPFEETVAEPVRSKSIIDFSDDDFFELIPEEGEFVGTEQPQIFAGGDYFSRKEMDAIDLDKTQPIDKFISEKPSLLRGNPSSSAEPVIPEDSDDFVDSGFYTETLARIYAEQGLVKRAVDVYAKLILLYPEKSTYFASLVKELKTKHNI
jgi:hypothetical protein